MYQPAQIATLNPVLISTFGMHGMGMAGQGITNANPASATWSTANRAAYMPLYIHRPGIVTKFWWMNGTVSAGNVDIGLYDRNYNRLTSTGTTAQGTVSVIQEVDVTDFGIVQGAYFIGFAMSNGTATVFQISTTASWVGLVGVTGQDTAFPLPNPAVPAQSSSGKIALCGIAFRTLVA